MSELKPRITGTEMEWGLLLSDDDRVFKEPTNELAEILQKDFPADIQRVKGPTGFVLGNGSRLYIDIGPHFEYATPEDTSFWGTVANEIAGEHIMTRMLTKSVARRGGSYRLHKRVVDDSGTTWGYHENYFMPEAKCLPSEAALTPMALHLASRQVFTGAGWQTKYGNFNISQKIHSLSNSFDRGTTGGNKPLVNLRDESHTDENKPGKRLHITSGDPNMSPLITYMKLATTSIVLRLTELGIQPDIRFRSHDAVLAAKRFTADPNLRSTYELEDRLHAPRKLTALDIQDYLVTLAEQTFSPERGLPPLPDEEVAALRKWRQMVDALKHDPSSQIGIIEWITKQALFGQAVAKGKMTPNNLGNMDRQWDLIDKRGLALRYREKRWAPWMKDVLIKERVHTAPSTTRARPRGRFVKLGAAMSPVVSMANWDYVSDGRRIPLNDPYDSSCSTVEALFARPQSTKRSA